MTAPAVRSDNGRARPVAAMTLSGLQRLFRHRYGVTLPDDDAGRDDLRLALRYAAHLSDGSKRMTNFVEV